MERFWILDIESSLRKERNCRIQRSVHILESPIEDFMNNYLSRLEVEGHGRFMRLKKRNGDLYQWYCERSRKPSGQSSGQPDRTRANNCSAYVSFQFVSEKNYNGCIVRLQPEHSGHDLCNSCEDAVNSVDPELLNYIHQCFSQGLSTADTLIRCHDWAKGMNKFEMGDRRYYVTLGDLKIIKRSFDDRSRMDTNDSASVDKMVKSDLQDSILYYQPLSHSAKQPLVIVFSSPWQIMQCRKYGPSMLFLDATYKGITQYGYAFYAVLVKSDQGRGVPVAFFIVSEETSDILSLCLRKLQEAAGEFQPRCIMIDRDLKEVNAVREVFPHARILLCWFHVLQAVHRWAVRNCITGDKKGNMEIRNQLLQAMFSLKNCKTTSEFDQNSLAVCTNLDKINGNNKISQYLKEHWLKFGAMWADFGRRVHHHNSDTNNLAERFFYSLKYQFLRGYANRRIDDLLTLLQEKVVSYYKYLEDLHDAKRTCNPKSKEFEDAVFALKEKGKGLHLQHSNGQCHVPSEANSSKNHEVNVALMTCDCPSSLKGNLCKHLAFAKFKLEEQGTSADSIRQQIASSLYALQNFERHGSNLFVHFDGITEVVHMQENHCTCLTNSLGEVCICLRLAEMICKQVEISGAALTESERNDHFHDTTNFKTNDELSVQDMICQLKEWAEGSEFKENMEFTAAIKHAYNTAFGNFTKTCHKRKIHRLHEYRQKIKKARNMTFEAHSYTLSNRKRVVRSQRPDSKFKRKPRKKRGKPFVLAS